MDGWGCEQGGAATDEDIFKSTAAPVATAATKPAPSRPGNNPLGVRRAVADDDDDDEDDVQDFLAAYAVDEDDVKDCSDGAGSGSQDQLKDQCAKAAPHPSPSGPLKPSSAPSHADSGATGAAAPAAVAPAPLPAAEGDRRMPEATSSGIVPATAPSVDTSMRTASPEPFIASGSHAADKPQMAPPLQAGGEQRDGPASQLPCSQDQQELQKGSEVVEGQAGAEADGGEDVQEDGHQLPLPVPVVCDESLLLMGPQETEPVQQHETEGGASAQETELVVADGNLTHEAEPPSSVPPEASQPDSIPPAPRSKDMEFTDADASAAPQAARAAQHAAPGAAPAAHQPQAQQGAAGKPPSSLVASTANEAAAADVAAPQKLTSESSLEICPAMGAPIAGPKPLSPRVKALKSQTTAISPTVSPRQAAAINATMQMQMQQRRQQKPQPAHPEAEQRTPLLPKLPALQHGQPGPSSPASGSAAAASAAPAPPQALTSTQPKAAAPLALSLLERPVPAATAAPGAPAPAPQKLNHLATARTALTPLLKPLAVQKPLPTGGQAAPAAASCKPLMPTLQGGAGHTLSGMVPLGAKTLGHAGADGGARSGGGGGARGASRTDGRGAAGAAGADKLSRLQRSTLVGGAAPGASGLAASGRMAPAQQQREQHGTAAKTPGMPPVAGTALAAAAAAAALAPAPGVSRKRTPGGSPVKRGLVARCPEERLEEAAEGRPTLPLGGSLGAAAHAAREGAAARAQGPGAAAPRATGATDKIDAAARGIAAAPQMAKAPTAGVAGPESDMGVVNKGGHAAAAAHAMAAGATGSLPGSPKVQPASSPAAPAPVVGTAVAMISAAPAPLHGTDPPRGVNVPAPQGAALQTPAALAGVAGRGQAAGGEQKPVARVMADAMERLQQMMLAMRSLEDEVLDLRVEAAIADNHMARLNNPAVARRIAALVQLSGAAVAAGEGEGGGAAQGGGTGAAGVGGGVGGAGVGVAEAMEVDGVGPEGGEGAS